MSIVPKKKFIGSIILIQALAVSSVVAFENVSPVQAYNMAIDGDNVYILDVRTVAEWKWVGHPGGDKSGYGAELDNKVVNIPYWLEIKPPYHDPIWPVENHKFIIDIHQRFSDDVVLITMCRSGGRSEMAAADLEQAGYTVYNMSTGFEGGKDDDGYRTVSGWKNDGLPYTY